MTMTHDQLHTHGPDELAMLRAECDKWHKAYDRVWEERMRFADRAIELEKENANLKRDKGMRERRLRRALWIAHAYKAKFKRWWLHLALDYEASMMRPNTKTINRIRGKIGNCEKSERKCRAKAEEYR